MIGARDRYAKNNNGRHDRPSHLGREQTMLMIVRATALSLTGAVTGLALIATAATAQTYGFATLPPGTLNHTTASAISKVLKEKGGVNMLVQPSAGDQVIVPMVGRGEVEVGITNIMEAQDGLDGQYKDMRIITAVHAPFFVRKDSGMSKIADLKGKRVAMGYSAMRNIDKAARAMLATAGLTEADVKPVLVPNVVRSADDFMAGNADMFYFAFGGPKVREADASVGGIRVLEMDDSKMDAARKIMPWGYATQVGPGPIFTGVEKPMKVYSFDNVLITSAKTPDAIVTKILETMEKHKDDLVAVQPVLREFTPEFGYKKYGVPYHPAAMKFFTERKLTPKPVE
jgi:TRAP transporter TAXI family solute receptor